MAEIPRFLVTDRTPRIAPGRTAGTVAPLQQISAGDAAAPGQALARVGSAIAGIGQVIEQIDARFQAARDLNDSQKALTPLSISMQQDADAQLAPGVIPDADAFIERSKAARDQALDNLSATAQPRFRDIANRRMLSIADKLRGEARARIITQGQVGHAEGGANLAQDLVGKTEEEAETLVDRFMLDYLPFEASGIVKPGATRLAADTARIGAIQLETRQDPEGMLAALKDQNRFTFLSGAQRTALIDDAEAEFDQKINRDLGREASDARKHKTVSGNERTTKVIEMASVEDDPEAVQVLIDEAVQMFDGGSGILESADAEFVTTYGRQLIANSENESRNVTDPAVLKEYYRLLFLDEDPQSAQDFVISHTGNGIGTNSVGALVNGAIQAKDARHYRNLTEVKDAVLFVEDQTGTTGNAMLDQMIGVQARGIQANARLEFMVQIASLAGPEGLDKDTVLQGLPAIRDAVVKTHRFRLKKLAESLGDEAKIIGFPQTGSVRDACNRWRFMLRQGVQKYEADAFLGRELLRHIARDTPADQSFNMEAAASELAGCMRNQPE